MGNDFVVLDGVSRQMPITADAARLLADRHFGVGCDQVLLAEKGRAADFRFRVFNRDGSEVGQCGNGARCFARFLRDNGLTDQDLISVETLSTRMQLRILDDGDISVDMGQPEFLPERIPFLADQPDVSHPLAVDGEVLEITALALGNPHAVIQVGDVATAPVGRLGPLVEHHPRFPDRVNAGFCEIVDPNHIRLRVHERGAGETLGCGSGACAAVVAGIRLGLLGPDVRVALPGGQARVRWDGPGNPVHLIGSASTVFTGVITIPGEAG